MVWVKMVFMLLLQKEMGTNKLLTTSPTIKSYKFANKFCRVGASFYLLRARLSIDLIGWFW